MHSGRITDSGIPVWTYCDPVAFVQERERLFRRSWGFACLAREVDRRGAYTVAKVGGDSVLVVHDGERRRAFHNVCRHRGAEVAAGTGVASELRCPYHAWTYRLDGTLDKVPGVRQIPEGIRLRELRLETWGPLVFVCSDPHAKALDHGTLETSSKRSDRGWTSPPSPRTAPPTSGASRWKRTGRSSSRTRWSATTAVSPTPDWPPPSTSPGTGNGRVGGGAPSRCRSASSNRA